MYNWSTDEDYLKQFPHEYEKWRLLQLINYGLDGEKISLDRLKVLWPEIKDEVLNPDMVKYIEMFLVPKNEKKQTP